MYTFLHKISSIFCKLELSNNSYMIIANELKLLSCCLSNMIKCIDKTSNAIVEIVHKQCIY